MTTEELAQLQEMVTKAADIIEGRLTNSLKAVIEDVNTKIEGNAAAAAEMQSTVKTALEAMPQMVQKHIEGQLQANLQSLTDMVSGQIDAKVKELTGGGGASGPGDGLNLSTLLAHSDKIVSLVNAFRSPTTDQAMMSQMNFVMKWHSLLSKLEKGGGTGEEFTKAISDTFTTEKKE